MRYDCIISKSLWLLDSKSIFKEEELQENSTTEYFSVVQKECNRDVCRNIIHYNLDAIIAVGYRVNSKKKSVIEYIAISTKWFYNAHMI